MQTYPHDPNAFTQGLEYDKSCNATACQDIFWESTGVFASTCIMWLSFKHSCSTFKFVWPHCCPGLYGQSTVREVDVLTGTVLRQQALPARDFGEGLTKFGNR